MAYTVDDTNYRVTLIAGTTEADLSGLTGLTDSNNNPITSTAGGDYDGDDGGQKVYTLFHPYVFRSFGNLTITPDAEQLVIENTDQRDNFQDFRLDDNSITFVNGEYNESYGTYYSKATFLRINRESNDTFRSSKACFYVHSNASLDWKGGVMMGGAVAAILGTSTSPEVSISNATWVGRSSNFFSISYGHSNYSAINFTIVGNRLYDTRPNVYSFGYQAINSLVEGGNNSVYENYTGIVPFATWTRYGTVRTFLNSSFGMNLPVSVFTSNKTQQGGVIKVNKSVSLTVIDTDRVALNDVKVVVKTYDNGDRIDYIDQPSSTPQERRRFTNQNSIVDTTGVTDVNGEFSFTNKLKEYTCRENVTWFSLSSITGNATAGDEINLDASNPTRKDGEFLYYDSTLNRVYFKRTRNMSLFYSSFVRMSNLSQTGTATWDGVTINQGTTNAIARFTKDGDDNAPFGDVITFKYGKQLTITALDYGGLGELLYNVFMLDDSLITESDKTIVGAYDTINTASECYDREALELENAFVDEIQTTVTKSGVLLNARDLDIDIDPFASSARSLVGKLLTIRSANFLDDMVTTGVISLLNGAIFSGTRTDENGTILPVTTLTVQVSHTGADVVVMEAGTNNVIASVDSQAGNDFVFEYSGEKLVDIGVILAGYKPTYTYNYFLAGQNQSLPISLIIDRTYI